MRVLLCIYMFCSTFPPFSNHTIVLKDFLNNFDPGVMVFNSVFLLMIPPAEENRMSKL